MKIVTSFIYPPIPNRNFDWTAVYDDTYDGAEDSGNRNHVGYGATEEAAIKDLKENFSEVSVPSADADSVPSGNESHLTHPLSIKSASSPSPVSVVTEQNLEGKKDA